MRYAIDRSMYLMVIIAEEGIQSNGCCIRIRLVKDDYRSSWIRLKRFTSRKLEEDIREPIPAWTIILIQRSNKLPKDYNQESQHRFISLNIIMDAISTNTDKGKIKIFYGN